MKTFRTTLSLALSLTGTLGFVAVAAAQNAPTPADPARPAASNAAPATPAPAPALTNGAAPADRPAAPAMAQPPAPNIPASAPGATNAAPAAAGAPATTNAAPSDLQRFVPPDTVVADGERGLRLNFKEAPLEMVLNYLSDAAGFIIVPEVDIRGRVNVWSNQPLTKDEAIDVLNSALAKNGYAALQNGRMLLIINKDQAKTRDLPVRSGSDPAQIPKSEEIVTQILPVKYINATQLMRDLQPLLPTSTTMTANEGGNSLVITDTQVHIRRMAEIVRALDTALTAGSSVRVFPLQYADAKALATVVKELFAPQQDTSRNNERARFFFRGPGGGGPPGMDGGGGGGGNAAGGGRAPTPRVVAVAEERANALVVSAPEDQMPIIEDLVKQVDTNVEDITELRVFRLKFADAQEMAELLANLFPDPTLANNQSGRRSSRFQFGGGMFGGPFGGMRGNNGTSTTQSERTLKESRVVAVPDMRTRSIVVSASRDLMPQIASMVEELDADPAQKQKVFVYSLENTDPETVQEVLESLFPAQTSTRGGSMRNSRNSNRQTGNQLNNRSTQMQNSSRRNNSSGSMFGNSFGTTGR